MAYHNFHAGDGDKQTLTAHHGKHMLIFGWVPGHVYISLKVTITPTDGEHPRDTGHSVVDFIHDWIPMHDGANSSSRRFFARDGAIFHEDVLDCLYTYCDEDARIAACSKIEKYFRNGGFVHAADKKVAAHIMESKEKREYSLQGGR